MSRTVGDPYASDDKNTLDVHVTCLWYSNLPRSGEPLKAGDLEYPRVFSSILEDPPVSTSMAVVAENLPQ